MIYGLWIVIYMYSYYLGHRDIAAIEGPGAKPYKSPYGEAHSVLTSRAQGWNPGGAQVPLVKVGRASLDSAQ